VKVPKRLEPLVQEGLIDEVLRQLMSGKEAVVFVVRSGSEILCAKVYKEANRRGFKQAALYQEGRKVKNSRQARAMEKKTRYGREAQEEAWQNVEVDTLYRLSGAGVRVPKPFGFFKGVVIMELVVDAAGHAAPRLNDITLGESEALEYHDFLVRQIVRMLSAGIIHGDLSEYNVLLGADGPVIIDLPQAVDAAANNNAEAMLLRDVENMRNYFSRFAPALAATRYGPEIWKLYQGGILEPDSPLTGRFESSRKKANVGAVIDEISAVKLEHEALLDYKARRTQ
jgi:RIO kinase 1